MSTTTTEAPTQPQDVKETENDYPFTDPDRLVPRTLHLLEEVQSVVRRIGGDEWHTAGYVDEGGDTLKLTTLGGHTARYAADLANTAYRELWHLETRVPHKPTGGDVSGILHDAGRTLAAVAGALEGVAYGEPRTEPYHIAWGCVSILDREIERIRARMEPNVIEAPEWERIRVKEVLGHLRRAGRAARGMDCHNAIEAVEVELETVLEKLAEKEDA